MSKRVLAIGVAALLTLLWGSAAGAAPTQVQRCESGKNKAAGKYAACRQNAQAKLVTTGDTIKYTEAITKCETKFADKWMTLEATAAKRGVSCLDASLTDMQFKTVIDGHSANITAALAGGALVDYPAQLTTCSGNLATCTGVRDQCVNVDLPGCVTTRDQCVSIDLPSCQTNLAGALACGDGVINTGEQCDQANLNGQTCATQGFFGGTLACGPACLFDTSGCYSGPRFVDNVVDGTITDKQTGLMWEKKAGLGGVAVICSSAVICPDPHDADNQYTWSTGSPWGPNGTVFTVFLAQLNAGAGFASHTDWRLPTREELQGLVDYADASSPVVNAAFDTTCSGSCTVTTCSCTASSSNYWSSSPTAVATSNTWIVTFSNGDVTNDTRDTDYYVRAVRSGP
jgi:uncharacterized protein DUF1566